MRDIMAYVEQQDEQDEQQDEQQDDDVSSDYSDVSEIMKNYNPDHMIPVYCTNIMCCAAGQCTNYNYVGDFCWGCNNGCGITYPRDLEKKNWDDNHKYLNLEEFPAILENKITIDDWVAICKRFNTNIDIEPCDSDDESEDEYFSRCR